VPDPEPTHVTYLTNVLNQAELSTTRGKVGEKKWSFNGMVGELDTDRHLFDYRKSHLLDPTDLRERKH
jgi:hypothetical protein